MLIEFEEKYLLELYQTGKTSDKKHRFQPQIIRGYKRAVDILKIAKRIEDLYPYKGLNFEILQGEKKGIYSVRANGQYRIEFTVREMGSEQIVTLCTILESNNHYR